MRPEAAPSPRTPREPVPSVPPSATGAQGRLPGRPRDDVTSIIMLILIMDGWHGVFPATPAAEGVIFHGKKDASGELFSHGETIWT